MHRLEDFKTCYFCSKEAGHKLTINPENKLLVNLYLNLVYNGTRYSTCEACGAIWDVGFNALREESEKKAAVLFEGLVVRGTKIKEAEKQSRQ